MERGQEEREREGEGEKSKTSGNETIVIHDNVTHYHSARGRARQLYNFHYPAESWSH